jgi:hypothetical protein
MEKYIGLDVHAASCTAAVLDARGKRLGSQVIETNGKALIEFFQTQAGILHVGLEEGTQSGWLVEIRPILAKLADLERELVLVGGQAVNFLGIRVPGSSARACAGGPLR